MKHKKIPTGLIVSSVILLVGVVLLPVFLILKARYTSGVDDFAPAFASLRALGIALVSVVVSFFTSLITFFIEKSKGNFSKASLIFSGVCAVVVVIALVNIL